MDPRIDHFRNPSKYFSIDISFENIFKAATQPETLIISIVFISD